MSKERLTEKCWRNLDPWECCGQDSYCKRGCHENGGCTNGCIVPKLYSRLAEYEDLEEQGLLLRLPCPIGTKVYYVQKCLAPSCKECLGFTRVDNCYTHYKARIFEQEFNYRHLKAFGESVFLTQAEAEEKLRELEGK